MTHPDRENEMEGFRHNSLTKAAEWHQKRATTRQHYPASSTRLECAPVHEGGVMTLLKFRCSLAFGAMPRWTGCPGR